MHRALRPQGVCSVCSNGLVTRTIRNPAVKRMKLNEAAKGRAVRARGGGLVCNAAKTLYDILGVPKTVSAKDLKSAFKKKALKLHPDVNKQPGAQEKFMEAKNAYQTLSDAESRRKYDQQLRRGDFESWSSSTSSDGFDWGGSAAGRQSYKPKQEEEEFYGLDDFFSDLEKDFEEWGKKRRVSGKPKSLWAELEDLGLEFVEFLEQGIDIDDEPGKGSAKSRPSANDSWREPQTRSRPEPPRKSAEEDIEDMLKKMKSDLGL